MRKAMTCYDVYWSCYQFPFLGQHSTLKSMKSCTRWVALTTGDPLHSRAACTQPCNVNTHSRAHCSPGARLCEQWGHGCVNNGARLCASARLCRGSPVLTLISWGTTLISSVQHWSSEANWMKMWVESALFHLFLLHLFILSDKT